MGVERQAHYYYVWVGLMQRGSPENMYLVPVGLTRSLDHGRLPPLRNEFWQSVCDKTLTSDSKVVLMTDAASAYRDVGHVGVVDKASVCHEDKEYARSAEVLANTLARHVRPATAGTQAIDSEWRYLKDRLFDALSARTEQGRARIDLHVRSEQWRRQRRNEDLWPRFYKAVQVWCKEKPKGSG